jgi:hypothetical protein
VPLLGEWVVRLPVDGRPPDPEVIRRALHLGLLQLWHAGRLHGSAPDGPADVEALLPTDW